ncbi:MAG: UDP-N-acetylmuramoyl-L-alanyl-D-glutamate--2,6-diaminopimelate ligase [Gammaproteobacteria bacterium]|nr:MAG: UDP-N-acetylmuramoyl-L-alanyl-D-glutamate--2,6-diaminopimelate ligase [Gammaproteobacteria bacterium]
MSDYRLSLGELLPDCPAPYAGIVARDLVLDSRKVEPGAVFVALNGAAVDGREFAAQAIERGAVAIISHAPIKSAAVPVVIMLDVSARLGDIAARFFADPSRALTIIGVTGTNGKTTCTQSIAQILTACGERCGVIGTLGVQAGQELLDAANTTPDAIALQRQFAKWRDAGITHVAMEVSSHALEQGRVNAVQFDVAVYTNLSHDHLDYHGNMSAYRQAKARLFAIPGLRRAVINIDDKASAAMVEALAADVETLFYSVRNNPKANVYVSDIREGLTASSAEFVSPWGEGELYCPLPGAFNVENVLACLAALGGEYPLQDLLAAIANLSGVAGRMQRVVGAANAPEVIVDYAHTPDALARVLQALRPHVSGQLFCVFGCGGDRDRRKRPLMGAEASRVADKLFITSDNPRGEDPNAIIDDIISGVKGKWSREADRAAAIAAAVAEAGPRDCVLIAGKGHESYQIIGEDMCRFSDVEQAQSALAERVAV